MKTRAERTRAETHVGDPPSPHTYFYVSNSASCCSTPLRWRASGPQTKREPWAGALTGKNATLPYETLVFEVAKPLKIVSKWIKKWLQNLPCLGHALGTLKIKIFVRFWSQHGPRWHPKLGPKMVCKCRWKGCISKPLPKPKTSPILTPSLTQPDGILGSCWV